MAFETFCICLILLFMTQLESIVTWLSFNRQPQSYLWNYVERFLTNIKLKALLYVSVAAASSLVMLFQDQNLLSCFSKCGCGWQSTNATSDHDHIQVLGHFVDTETWTATHRNTFSYQVLFHSIDLQKCWDWHISTCYIIVFQSTV